MRVGMLVLETSMKALIYGRRYIAGIYMGRFSCGFRRYHDRLFDLARIWRSIRYYIPISRHSIEHWVGNLVLNFREIHFISS